MPAIRGVREGGLKAYMRIQHIFAALVMLLVLSNTALLHAAALDSTLYTTYDTQAPYTNVVYSVCGSLPQSEGCYGGGNLGPFGMIGAMIEGDPQQNLQKGTVTRFIYVLDVANGTTGQDVALYVYKRVDTITSSNDSITVSLFKTVSIPLPGGSATVAYMAANSSFLYVGTTQGGSIVQVKKNTLAAAVILIPPIPLDSLTADQYGFVTVESGSRIYSQFNIINPNGSVGGDGGGTAFMLNTIQGTQPSTVVPQ